MHEAALAAPLLRLVLEEAARHEREQGQRLRVTGVTVRAGLLMAVEPATLAGIFAIMAEGTATEGAALLVELEAMVGSCPDCGNAGLSIRARDFHCPDCGGERVAWQGGNELYVASITVRPEPEEPPRPTES